MNNFEFENPKNTNLSSDIYEQIENDVIVWLLKEGNCSEKKRPEPGSTKKENRKFISTNLNFCCQKAIQQGRLDVLSWIGTQTDFICLDWKDYMIDALEQKQWNIARWIGVWKLWKPGAENCPNTHNSVSLSKWIHRRFSDHRSFSVENNFAF